MKKVFLVSVVFLFLLVGNIAVAVADFKYGNEGKVATQFGKASVDYEALASSNLVVLFSSPIGEDGQSSMVSVFFIFRADRSADSFNLIIDYNGDGQVGLIDALLSTQTEVREVIFPINGKDSSDGKRTIPITEPLRFVDKNGNIEVHISVSNGQAITLNSVSVEYVYQQEQQVREVVKVVNRYYGVLPPGYSYSLVNYYHKGPIWVWSGYGWSVYDGWWYSPTYIQWVRVYYPKSIYRYYYHYCGEVYVRENYVHHRHSDSGGSRRKESERRGSLQRRAPERDRSVEGNSNDRRTLAVGNSLKLQNGSDRSKTVIDGEGTSSVVGSASVKGTRQLSREAVAELFSEAVLRKTTEPRVLYGLRRLLLVR